MTRFLHALLVVALVAALPGLAAAKPCPKCDPGSGDNWWSTANVGAVGNATGPVKHNLDMGAVENTGVGTAHSNDKRGFWAFLTICFEAWSHKLAEMTGFDLHLKGDASVYADQHGVDVDAHALGQDFEKTALNKTDDLTWQANAEARAKLHEQGVDLPTAPGLPTEKLPTAHADVCVDAQITVPCL